MEDLEKVEDGDVILSPTYLQWRQMQMNMQQQQQQQQQQEQQMQQEQAQQEQQQQEQPPVNLGDGQSIPERSLMQRSLNAPTEELQPRVDDAIKALGYIEIDV